MSIKDKIIKMRDDYVVKQVAEIELPEFEPDKIRRYLVIFSGRVQHIGFRLEVSELAKRLDRVMPEGLSSYFFVSSGSEANDAAMKMARSYHLNRGDAKRYKVISRQGSYHGTTVSAMSATGIDYFRKNYEPMVNDFVSRSYPSTLTPIAEALQGSNCRNAAAVNM